MADQCALTQNADAPSPRARCLGRLSPTLTTGPSSTRFLQLPGYSESFGPRYIPMTDQSGVPITLRNTISEKGKDGWDFLYKAGIIPWDKGVVSPALAGLIKKGEIPDGLVIIPGCGSGYDIAALASPTRKAIGIDISETAVERARKVLEGHQNAEILLADFFALTDFDGQADALFDYTFLCALPPTMRDQWADKMAALVKKGGLLVTLMFPLDVHEGGPPFTLSPEIYKGLLLHRGFEIIRIEDEIESFPTRAGNEKLGLWRRV